LLYACIATKFASFIYSEFCYIYAAYHVEMPKNQSPFEICVLFAYSQLSLSDHSGFANTWQMLHLSLIANNCVDGCVVSEVLRKSFYYSCECLLI